MSGPVARLAEQVGGSVHTEFGDEVCDVPPQAWRTSMQTLVSDGYDYLDWLSIIDNGESGLRVVAHLVRLPVDTVDGMKQVLLTADLVEPRVQSVTSVLPGADWHEREAAEMFGVEFLGHPRPGPLLLRAGFQGHPLRKDFPLTARVQTSWPGTHEPGADAAKMARSRRRTTPPGLPDQWLADTDRPSR